MDVEYTCTECERSVTPDEAFIRSVNLTTTAWCRPCWFAKHADLSPVPEQRSAGPTKHRARGRWLIRR